MPNSAASVGRQGEAVRQPQPLRNYLLLIGLVVIAVWLVLVFSRTLGELNEATGRAAVVRGEAEMLQARLEQGERELELVQTDAFLRLQARGYGMGEPGERIFSLEAGAPAPPSITPLGVEETASTPISPLDAWLELLFGS